MHNIQTFVFDIKKKTPQEYNCHRDRDTKYIYKMEEKQIHEEQSVNNLPKKRRKPPEPGVIYLSKIPALMNVKTIRDIFSQYGEIGKIFLQPNGKLYQMKPTAD